MNAIARVNCGSCKACCTGGEMIFLHPANGDEPARYMTRVVRNPLNGEEQLALVQKPNGDCIYLGDNGCTIYGRHPVICREFDCMKFARRMDEVMRDLRGAEKRRARKRLIGTAYAIGSQKLMEATR